MSEDIYHLGIKGLIRNAKGEVLLLQVNPAHLHNERSNYWDLPGGRVQQGDSVLKTLERELAEETGITTFTNPEQVGMVLSNLRIPLGNDTSAGLILAIFACDIADDATITLSEEHTNYGWFAPAAAAKELAVKYPSEFCETIAKL